MPRLGPSGLRDRGRRRGPRKFRLRNGRTGRHDWQLMPGYRDERCCSRCKVVRALAGTGRCRG